MAETAGEQPWVLRLRDPSGRVTELDSRARAFDEVTLAMALHDLQDCDLERQSFGADLLASVGSHSHKTALAAIRGGAVPPLVGLLVTAAGLKDERGFACALKAICTLALANEDCIYDIVAGGLQGLMEVLDNGALPTMRVHATKALTLLAAPDQVAALFVRNGAIKHVVQMLDTEAVLPLILQPPGLPSLDPNRACAASAALVTMAQGNNAIIDAIVGAGAIPKLVRMLGQGGIWGRESAARCIRALLSVKDAARQAATVDAIAPLLRLISIAAASDQPGIQKCALAALHAIVVNNPATQSAARQQGAVKALRQTSLEAASNCISCLCDGTTRPLPRAPCLDALRPRRQ